MTRATLKTNYEKVKQTLLKKPLSLLGEKVDIILEYCKSQNVKTILEIGSFAGGSAYVIAKSNPNIHITSIDINNFEEYFSKECNRHIFDLLQKMYGHIKIYPQDLPIIQQIYNDALTNIKITQTKLSNFDLQNFDAIIVDGDHSIEGLRNDLEITYTNNNKCMWFVDDCSYYNIKDTANKFAQEKNLNIEYTYDFENKKDLGIITRRK